MKFLLFFVSLIFSYIFYIFYNLTKGKNYFGGIAQTPVNLESLSGNLLIESYIFLFLGIIFLFIFSSFKSSQSDKKGLYKNEIMYFLFYTLFIFYMYFLNKGIDLFVIFITIIFISSDILFNHLSNIKKLSDYKVKFRYLGLILNYLSIVLSIYYILKNGINYVLFFILLFNLYFNILVHKKYTNYISLLFSISIMLFLLYCLYLFVIKPFI